MNLQIRKTLGHASITHSSHLCLITTSNGNVNLPEFVKKLPEYVW